MLTLLLTLALSSPPRLTVTAQTGTTQDVTVAWDASVVSSQFPAATGYRILHGTDCAALRDEGGTNAQELVALRYTFAGLRKDLPHCFAVRAYNDAGLSAPSATAFLPAGEVDQAPLAPILSSIPIVVKPTDVISLTFCEPAQSHWNSLRWFVVQADAALAPYFGPVTKGTTDTCGQWWATPQAFTFAVGTHTAKVALVNHVDGMPDVQGPFSAPLTVTSTPAVDCTGTVVLTVGDWTRTANPGDSGRVLFALTKSARPIVKVDTFLDGVLLEPLATGPDLRWAPGRYFKLPKVSGDHKLSVTAYADNGCTASSGAPMTLRVR